MVKSGKQVYHAFVLSGDIYNLFGIDLLQYLRNQHYNFGGKLAKVWVGLC